MPPDPFCSETESLIFFLSTWNAQCPIFLGNFTPKTSNYCLKYRALGFPGIALLLDVMYFSITLGECF